MGSKSTFEQVAATLLAGKAAVFPTDTVYGIGVAVGIAPTPQEIYGVKLRDSGKAVPWLVENPNALDEYGRDVPDYARGLAEEYWPGPLTIIVPAADSVPVAFAGPRRTIALRMPDDQTALALIAAVGRPLATSSANLQGHTPPQLFSQVDEAVLSQVEAAIGDDVARSGLSSTIVDCIGPTPVVLRVGSVSEADVAACCARVDANL